MLRPLAAAETPLTAPEGSTPAFPRLDLPAKVDGSFQFAGDVRLPDMVYAAIRHGPWGEAELSGFDAKAATGTPGLVGVVKGRNWLAAAATDWWAAERALVAMAAHFRAPSRPDSNRIEAALDKAIRFGEAHRLHEAGDPDEVLTGKFSLALRYDVAPALHATLMQAQHALHGLATQLQQPRRCCQIERPCRAQSAVFAKAMACHKIRLFG